MVSVVARGAKKPELSANQCNTGRSCFKVPNSVSRGRERHELQLRALAMKAV
jgi:hypothetical protein